ncbi:MAG: 2-deoxyglucose-6-phosphatase [Myxococcaceae bacterium]|nr:2-deoxyglucose-6-phosphatase [Myxococcaceae bacterium]
MLSAAIFDMDGLLIDSEPFWREVEIQVFNKVGVPLDEQMCLQTMGMRVDQLVRHWFERYPWQGVSEADVARQVIEGVAALIECRAEPLPGAHAAVMTCAEHGLRLGLASSSPARLIHAVLKRLELHDAFQVIHSADDEEHGKPHPAVYLTAAKKLGVLPPQCVAFEDSFHGALSAKAARMKVVAVPAQAEWDAPRFGFVDLKLRSLAELNFATLERLSAA